MYNEKNYTDEWKRKEMIVLYGNMILQHRGEYNKY